jgi:glutathione S-transferase
MNNIRLVLGNKNYSSWSLRAWLCLRKCGIDFEETLIPLDTPEFAQRISEYSPTGRVPVLWHEDRAVWDSLAICEYANDVFADGRLWPRNTASRALGRCMAAEMHSGFLALRNEMPMNCRAVSRQVPLNEELKADIDRICFLWSTARADHMQKGDWLLGEFSIADAMFAPVVQRFKNYGIQLPELCQQYCEHVHGDIDMQAWVKEALQESWIVEADEAGSEQPVA